MKYQGQWVEEMVNNRKASFVKDMKWSPDGTKICIAYEDGNVIVGGVEGNRKWGKEYPHRVAMISWAPTSKELMIGTNSG
jgi:WD repeat-containing protein 35